MITLIRTTYNYCTSETEPSYTAQRMDRTESVTVHYDYAKPYSARHAAMVVANQDPLKPADLTAEGLEYVGCDQDGRVQFWCYSTITA